MDWFGVFFAVVLGGVFLAYVLITQRHDRAKLKDLRARAEAQFRGLVVRAEDQRYSFSGESATVVTEVERISRLNQRVHDAWIVRFCRNPHGEYFEFISNSSRSAFIKHVPQHLAKIALKQKYEAPD